MAVVLTVGIAIGQDELSGDLAENIGFPDGLIEESRQSDGEVRRAVALHDEVWIRDMVSMVGRVKVLAIPAGREHQLDADAIAAELIQVVLAWEVMPIQRSLRGLVIVEAVEPNCSLCKVDLGSLS